MEKALNEYILFIENEVEKLKEDFASAKNQKIMSLLTEKARELQSYHYEKLRDFQHERLIHLVVTIFFACMTLLSIIFLFIFALSPMMAELIFVNYCLFGLSIILIILESFYIKHYCCLENGTQKLYEYSKEIYELLNKNK